MAFTALSLFANVGISETYLTDMGIEVAVANELEPERGRFYQHLYPETAMIVGDITKEEVFHQILCQSQKAKVDFLLATPPCQGMSTAGKGNPHDPRNALISYAVEAILCLKPRYALLENVPSQLVTPIQHHGTEYLIPQYLQEMLGKEYFFHTEPLVNAMEYGVGQRRERAIFLLTRKDQTQLWSLPPKEPITTLAQVIGDLPSLDPFVYDLNPQEREELFPCYEEKRQHALTVSPWHSPPRHVYRQVLALQHTPSGKSAFQNEPAFRPKKKDGTLVKGYANTYKRQDWSKPAYTVTMYNRTIGSQNNGHPGRLEPNGLYSDPRVLSVYEIMLVMSLPPQWNIPPWVKEPFLRGVIGEGIPPLLMKKLVGELVS